jgi:glutathione S-transferase
MRILHVALPDDWARARRDGSYDVSTRGVSLVEEGYIHASTAVQLPGVLARFFADVPAVDLLVMDLAMLDHEGAQVLWEDVTDADDGPYPHVYGVVPAQTVVDVIHLEHQPGTSWSVPEVADVATGPGAEPA